MSYREELGDPRWQKKRLKILNYANWRCQICGAKDLRLEVHHSYYERGKKPWQYPDGSLIAVCFRHHALIRAEHIAKKATAPSSIDPGTAAAKFAELKRIVLQTQERLL